MSENNPIDLEAIRAENKIAQETLSHLCHEKWAGRDGWHWEIPANPSRDTDLQLGASIQSSNKLCDEVESLRQRVRELEAEAQRLHKINRYVESEYLLPVFDYARKLGIDLQDLVYKNAGKNSTVLFCETVLERIMPTQIPTPTEGAKA